MNDPLRNFVRQHREEFDDYQPSANVLDKVRQEIRLAENPKKPAKSYWLYRWGVAATISLALGTYFIRISRDTPPIEQAARSVRKITQKQTEKITGSPEQFTFVKPRGMVNNTDKVSLQKSRQKKMSIQLIMETAYGKETDSILRLLSDGQSAANRIKGLIRADKLSHVKESLMETVFKSATEDENSNVRLAAIDLIVSRMDQPYIMEMLKKTFIKQDDPFALNELMDVITKMDKEKSNASIQEKLRSLVNDPKTMEFVKDKAYAVLIKY